MDMNKRSLGASECNGSWDKDLVSEPLSSERMLVGNCWWQAFQEQLRSILLIYFKIKFLNFKLCLRATEFSCLLFQSQNTLWKIHLQRKQWLKTGLPRFVQNSTFCSWKGQRRHEGPWDAASPTLSRVLLAGTSIIFIVWAACFPFGSVTQAVLRMPTCKTFTKAHGFLCARSKRLQVSWELSDCLFWLWTGMQVELCWVWSTQNYHSNEGDQNYSLWCHRKLATTWENGNEMRTNFGTEVSGQSSCTAVKNSRLKRTEVTVTWKVQRT